MPLNKEHSFRDYLYQSLARLPAGEFSGTTIKGSCFAQAKPDTVVFPVGTVNVTFERCNLDNVALPPGSVLSTKPGLLNTTRRILPFEMKTSLGGNVDGTKPDSDQVLAFDVDDWEVDGLGSPVRPVNAKKFERYGLSIDPADYQLIDASVSVGGKG